MDKEAIYKVLVIEEKSTVGMGPCYLTNIISESGERTKIFLPKPLFGRIERERREGYSPYFVPTGQKVSNGRKYNT